MAASLRGRESGSRGTSALGRLSKQNSEDHDGEHLSLCDSDF
jgi:hypothetical protein